MNATANVPGDTATEEIPQVLKDNEKDIRETQAALGPPEERSPHSKEAEA